MQVVAAPNEILQALQAPLDIRNEYVDRCGIPRVDENGQSTILTDDQRMEVLEEWKMWYHNLSDQLELQRRDSWEPKQCRTAKRTGDSMGEGREAWQTGQVGRQWWSATGYCWPQQSTPQTG